MNYRSFIKRDYKLTGPGGRPARHHSLFHPLTVAGAALVVAIAIFSLLDFSPAEAHIAEQPLPEPNSPAADASHIIRSIDLPEQAELPLAEPAAKLLAATAATSDKRIKVRKGDTLAAIFARNQLGARDVHDIIALGKPTRQLKSLRPGETIVLNYDAQGKFSGLVHEQNRFESLHVSRGIEGFQARHITRKPDVRVAYASGTINNSLFLDGKKAGLAQGVIMELAGIFGWDIDFALDIREGDRFHVVYEEQYLDGEKIRNGNILAAEFVNNGKNYRAVRYVNAGGRADYYTPNGYNMRKAFLRTPVDFSRISSRFGKRKHPILNSMRLHTGVDYAAKRGTPIRATGDGKIVYRGRKGGYGKTVIIRHGSKYSTLYAHMSSFNRKARSGSRVKQGQVIGYVGSTGRATGPHLHYEFRVHGVHRNPLTVKLPSAASIAKRHKQDFLNKTQGLIAQLDGLKRVELALAP